MENALGKKKYCQEGTYAFFLSLFPLLYSLYKFSKISAYFFYNFEEQINIKANKAFLFLISRFFPAESFEVYFPIVGNYFHI